MLMCQSVHAQASLSINIDTPQIAFALPHKMQNIKTKLSIGMATAFLYNNTLCPASLENESTEYMLSV